jgi:hypothetical protein
VADGFGLRVWKWVLLTIKIPYQQTEDRQFNQFQVSLAKELQSVVANPLIEGIVLKQISLTGSGNVVPTLINRTLQGWFLVRNRTNSVVWDSQDTNVNATQTLILNTTAATIVDIFVY